ncbi:MAG: dTMP kinase [Candidatus Aenigmatarchaeota archaeon]
MSLFIVFEGIIGAGKKTHIKLLAERLKGIGREVTIISFPDYDGEIARLTRRIEFDPITQSLLFAADRTRSQERIKSFLEKGTIVLCNRYCYSNFVHQKVKGVPLEWLICIEKLNIKPHIGFLIDVPIEISIQRIQQLTIEDFTKGEILERLQREKETMEEIRMAYLDIVRKDKEVKWFVIDGSKDITENHEKIWKIVSGELTKT